MESVEKKWPWPHGVPLSNEEYDRQYGLQPRLNLTVAQRINEDINRHLAEVKRLENLRARLPEVLLEITENELLDLVRLTYGDTR